MTLGLAIIVKEYDKRVHKLVMGMTKHVDTIYIQINGSDTAIKEKLPDNVEVSAYEWNDNFADARNALHQEIKTDYWLWLDDDDVLEGAENLRDMCEDMKSTGTDVMYFPYHYEIDEIGETVIYQWRERILRTGIKGKWLGTVHETFVPEEEVKVHKTDGAQVYHVKSEADKKKSQERNHKILLDMYKQTPRDPRYTHYLAISHHGREEWEEAIKMFLEHIRESGWPEESYRSWINIADCLFNQGKYDEAMDAATQAMKLLPHYPNAYYVMQQATFHQDHNEESLEWFSMAEQKPVPETSQAHDPTVYKFRAKLMAAMSFMFLGEPEQAYALMKKVEKIQPNSPMFKDLMPEVVRAYFESQAVKKAEWLMEYESEAKGNPAKVLESLPAALQSDVRLSEIRSKVLPAVKWPDKSIVFYCGPGLEKWGPDTLDKGMGGSEEAIVYLSRELAKLGWQVTIYNDREEEYVDAVETTEQKLERTVHSAEGSIPSASVIYKPWTTFNPADTFDVLVAWRNPTFHKDMKTKARIKAVDMHDVVGEQPVEDGAETVDKFFVKSNYHRSLYTKVADDKFEVISNGIDRSQFK